MTTSHWMVGGGAEHSVEMVRRDTFAKMGGAEGIVGVSDLLVRPYAIPGTGVRVAIGSAYMRSRYQASTDQMYLGSVIEEELVPIPENTGSSTRRDLIVMRMKDPYVQGSPWPDPAQGIPEGDEAEQARNHAQYVFVERIPSVPAGTKRLQDVPGYENDTAVVLARIDIPATTGTITTGMITDLRHVAVPKTKRVVRALNLTAAGTPRTGIASTTPWEQGGIIWPQEAENAGILDIDIPEWATHMAYRINWSQLDVVPNGRAEGQMWLQVGHNADPNLLRGQPSVWRVDAQASPHTMSFGVSDTMRIPQALRGQTKRFYPRVTRTLGVTAGTPAVMWASSFDIDVTFEERAS